MLKIQYPIESNISWEVSRQEEFLEVVCLFSIGQYYLSIRGVSFEFRSQEPGSSSQESAALPKFLLLVICDRFPGSLEPRSVAVLRNSELGLRSVSRDLEPGVGSVLKERENGHL
jgi:hypothetical protein